MEKSSNNCHSGMRCSFLIKERDSNIELLRIVSMFLVMIVHADYLALGTPTQEDISASYCNSFARAFVEALSCICVNVFVLISGWFKIKFRFERLMEFIFQVIFIGVALYFLMRVWGYTEVMSIKDWTRLFLMKSRAYWFVKAYLILYVFAPLLNSFIDNCNRSQLKVFLIGFFFLQSIYGFYASNVWFSEGYSPLSFMGLYILSSYMRLYPNCWVRLCKYIDMTIYLSISAFTALCAILLTPLFEKGSTLMFLYSSPFVIMASVYFFLFFTKLSFKSKFVNWISISAFAAFLVHCSDYVFEPFYLSIIRGWYDAKPLVAFIFYTTGLIVLFFSFSIVLDKVRIALWKRLLAIKYLRKDFPNVL